MKENRNMKKIGGRKKVFWKIVLQRLCWKINDFMKIIRDHCFCYYEVDRDRVKQKVQEVNDKAERFVKVEEQLPNIYAALKELKKISALNNGLVRDVEVLQNYLFRLYVADLSGDEEAKREIYGELFKNKILI